MWAKIRGIVIGSVRRGTATGKRRVLGGVLFARDGIEEPEDSTRIRTRDRLEQVACQVADLAVEMTEDVLREASMYLRRWASDRCTSEQALRRSRTADSASWDHQALGEQSRQPKGIETLAALTKKREKERAAWWMVTAPTSREGRCSTIYDWWTSLRAFL